MDVCSKQEFSLRDNFDLFHHDLQRVRSVQQNPCSQQAGRKNNSCLQVLERHYKQVSVEVKERGRKLDWHSVEKVEKLANDMDIKCEIIS